MSGPEGMPTQPEVEEAAAELAEPAIARPAARTPAQPQAPHAPEQPHAPQQAHAPAHAEAGGARPNAPQRVIDATANSIKNALGAVGRGIWTWGKSAAKGAGSLVWNATGGTVAEVGKTIGHHAKRGGSRVREAWHRGKEQIRKEKNIAKLGATVGMGADVILESATIPLDVLKGAAVGVIGGPIKRVIRGTRDALVGVFAKYDSWGGTNESPEAQAAAAGGH